ncbi:hypothetical protein JF50_13995 [Pseudoalteromonas luteoviolacea]|uniref:Uncharacterized protein n=1 Tax=Pseudoalteromonas luteoviolacea TaxID=43657 RepID=A0A0C1QPI2_9GAMM|nr:hypothetical protein [Pseudoalteromonas luteoviolacea]KID56977.1 hypothetical protein JF50_13995 [Pseudoalteromonas luteoviolacea]
MFKRFLMIGTLALSLQANAGGSTESGKISQMYVNAGWTMVHLPNLVTTEKGTKNNPDSCENNHWYALEPSDQNYTTLHSTLMTAQISEKSVHFWVSGCGGQDGKYPKITSIWLNT